jgi:cell division protein FtsN
VEFKINKKIKVDTTIKKKDDFKFLDSLKKVDNTGIIEKNKKKDNEDLSIGNTCTQIGNYYVQCGVFKNKNSAFLLAKKIKSKTDAFIGIEENNALYKVQVGCSPDKTEVNNIMQKLIERKFSEKMFIGIRK